MDWFTGIIAYLLIWWTALFAVLPWGNQLAQNPVPGQAHGAPDFPRLKRKFFMTTVLSAVLWVALYLLVNAHIVDFSGIADSMMAQDAGP